MTTVRTVAAHDVVAHVFPRPVKEGDELGLAVGKVVDATLSHLSHVARLGRRLTATAVQQFSEGRLREELIDEHLNLPDTERQQILAQVAAVVRAFRASELFGLSRPKSRLVVIDDRVGVYVQPDFWNGKDRIFEMKSYRSVPPSPEVLLQLRLFQLGFPGFSETLVCFDRRADPVSVTRWDVPPAQAGDERQLLLQVEEVATARGVDKVLAYVDAPVVRRSLRGRLDPNGATGPVSS